jgi:hypothetical protein
MRRQQLLKAATLALFGFAAIAGVSAIAGTVDNPNTPADFAATSEEMCLLDKLEFSNGLRLVETFQPNRFHYTCTYGAEFTGKSKAIVHLEDNGSSAEVTFNGQKLNFRTMSNALSNGGDNGQAPRSPIKSADGSSEFTLVAGKNTIVVGVGCNGFGLPETCYYQYTITCEKSGFIVGDPQFIGLRGQSYQVHGVSGEVYNIVSDADLQYNSKFVFLDEGECPVVNGKKLKGCWSHPGSYLGELGLKTRAGDKIRIVSGPAKKGFAAVEVNGKELSIDETFVLADNLGSISRNSTHLASVSVGNWNFAFENSDMFVNQRVRVIDARQLRSHGLLGQTWRETTYPNAIKYIQGEVDDYVIRDQELFGDSFVFNAFN